MDEKAKKEIIKLMVRMQMSEKIINDFESMSKVYAGKNMRNRIKFLELNTQQLKQIEEIETDTRTVFHVITGKSQRAFSGRKNYYELYLFYISDPQHGYITEEDGIFTLPVYYTYDSSDIWGEDTLVRVLPFKGGLEAL